MSDIQESLADYNEDDDALEIEDEVIDTYNSDSKSQEDEIIIQDEPHTEAPPIIQDSPQLIVREPSYRDLLPDVAVLPPKRQPSAGRSRRPPTAKNTIKPKIQEASSDSLFDSLFDQLESSLKFENQQATINKGKAMREYAEQMRKEAITRYGEEEELIRKRFQVKQHEIAKQKENLSRKQKDLEQMIIVKEQKAQFMIESLDHMSPNREMPPIQDQGWRLIQNWLFSLITDSEKCVRYSLIKSKKQVEHVQKEKLRYQEGRVQNVLQQTIQNLKQLPLIKLNLCKSLKPLKPQLLTFLDSQSLQGTHFEHLGTLRSKPYLKQPESLTYRVHTSDLATFPSLSTLTSDSGALVDTACQLMHLSPVKLPALPCDNLDQLLSNDVLHPFQEPELTSKKELRIFVCALEAQDSKIDLAPFRDLANSHGLLKVDEKVQIKRLKGSNQLKVQKGGVTAVLSEAKMRHMVRSRVYRKYVENGNGGGKEGIENFYIIEENSMFCMDSQQSKIINSQRKIRHFRKLSDFEMLLLICKSFGHLIPKVPQSVELKFVSEPLKNQQDKGGEDIQTFVNQLHSEGTRYMMIDCLSEGRHLFKQYLVKYRSQKQMLPKMEEILFCNYPNCLQACLPSFHGESLHTQKSQLVQAIPNQIVSIKKPRPESAGNRTTNSLPSTRGGQFINGPKRLTRVPMILDMDIQDSPFSKVYSKRFKQLQTQPTLMKDKSVKSISNSGQTIDQPQQVKSAQRRETLQNSSQQSQFCIYHRDFEKFLIGKLNLNLQMIQLRPNNFHKALKQGTFAQWKEELKGSLAHDLFAKPGAKSTQKSLIADIFSKIFNHCLQQSDKIMPDVGQYTDLVFSQQPQIINFLENYYQWINKACSLQKLIFIKSQAFIEANQHFSSQLQAFNMNLKQAKENEIFLTCELKKWICTPIFMQSLAQLNLGQQLFEIVRSKDVLFKFQQFQNLSDRITSQSADLQQQNVLPKISQSQHQSITQGFFPRQESFNSNAKQSNMDKLSQIYGQSVAPQNVLQTSIVNNKKQPTTAQIISGQQILRKQSAGNKRSEDNASLGNQQYYSYQQIESRTQQQDSPQSNKNFKNMTKNEILLPISQTLMQGKPRASSAHKQNLQQQQVLQSQVQERAGTNTSIYEMMPQGVPQMMRNSRQLQSNDPVPPVQVQPKFQQGSILQVLASSGGQLPQNNVPYPQPGLFNPISQVYGGRMPRTQVGASNILSGASNKPTAAKHLERQQIIISTYGQPTSMPAYSNVGPPQITQGTLQFRQNLGVATSQMNPAITLPQQQRVASANNKRMHPFEKIARKSKKKSANQRAMTVNAAQNTAESMQGMNPPQSYVYDHYQLD